MEVHEYKEREDGGADLQIELDPEETRLLIEVGLIKVLKDYTEEHEKQFEDDKRSWKGVSFKPLDQLTPEELW